MKKDQLAILKIQNIIMEINNCKISIDGQTKKIIKERNNSFETSTEEFTQNTAQGVSLSKN